MDRIYFPRIGAQRDERFYYLFIHCFIPRTYNIPPDTTTQQMFIELMNLITKSYRVGFWKLHYPEESVTL